MQPFPTSAPPLLTADALTLGNGAATLRLRLPWIRSLPLSSVRGLELRVDGTDVPVTELITSGSAASPGGLADMTQWWHLQDALEVRTGLSLDPGAHDVQVSLRLLVPYLPGGPDTPLVITCTDSAVLTADAAAPPAATHDRTAVVPPAPLALPEGWVLSASAFNWTPEILRGARPAVDIVQGIVAEGVARVIEVEPGQTWRSFPATPDDEAERLRAGLVADGGSVSIVGASLDDWLDESRRRTDDDRLAFLLPQLRTARALGAHGVRLPIGQAGPALLTRLLPYLHEWDLTLYEEMQGPQRPSSVQGALSEIADRDDPRLRLLVDCSLLMPALPPTYLAALQRAGVRPALLDRLASDWLDEGTPDAVIAALRDGSVPAGAHTLFMDLIVRFGRSQVADLADLLPLVGAFHLKFWDLHDDDSRISAPLRELGDLLRTRGFAGTLCSEWGGHGWLADEQPADMTRRHLALAASALTGG